MRPIHALSALLVAQLVLVLASTPAAEPRRQEAAAPAAAAGSGGRLFDGEEKTFVFVGYSTSYRWPNILELMMNRPFEDQIVYHVMNAAAGGAPVGTWIAEPGTRDYERSYLRMLRDYFLPLPNRPELEGRRRYPNVPRPTIALLQQSLQLTTPIIQGPDDEANVRAGADAMQKLCERLHADGVELIFITTHIYKYTHEPQVEHEKYALAELLRRDLPYVWPGPEVWRATKARWPEIFTQPDQVHLNKLGDGVDARLWYEHLLRYDRGELERNLDSAWGPGWEESVTLAERAAGG
ncbi:MAG: hypothetical protein D6696_18240 [Acidobacteria bacterium]|nr:MAG: hypothetical protein D6696_18240 [Acidobacteriota bacterium]